MVSAVRQRFSFRDYVELEEISNVKHEFLEGHVWAMAGGTPDHARIAANLITLLGTALRGKPCAVFSADLRVRVRATGLGTYPDVSVVCGALERDPDDPRQHTVLNPKVVIEVLSPSTEEYDRGEKLAHYKQVPSLDEIVLVAHDEPRLEVWRRRDGDRWTVDVARETGAAHLASLQLDLPLGEIYRDPLA